MIAYISTIHSYQKEMIKIQYQKMQRTLEKYRQILETRSCLATETAKTDNEKGILIWYYKGTVELARYRASLIKIKDSNQSRYLKRMMLLNVKISLLFLSHLPNNRWYLDNRAMIK